MNALASARETAFGEVELTFPFSEALRDALKSEIPQRYRKWDADDRVWRIMGVYGETAIGLLLEHFPRAEVPDDQPRRRPALVARTEKPPVAMPPLPPLDSAISPEPDRPELDHLTASVRCPKCRRRYDQPLRVVTESSRTVAKRETVTPEFVSICPACNFLAVVAFFPAVAALQEATR